ncbi:MAG: hypothetical protein HZB56_10490 [Deltaproteobacteria bacterium]|nr:hypothetical protein [Deltaproteobacteria bacterium]
MRVHQLLGVALLCAARAGAQQPDPRLFAPPSADATPTAFACTVETLAAGKDCVFEGQALAAADPVRQAQENGKTAAALGNQLCGRASRLATQARADAAVLAACQRSFVEKAGGCAADGSAPLLDAEGRFGAGARACYAAMSEVLARARFMAAATGGCCRCLTSAGCVKSGEQCNRSLSAGATGGACLEQRCGEACRAFLPEPSAPPPAPRASPAALPPLDRSGEPRNL